MNLTQRIDSFVQLGLQFAQMPEEECENLCRQAAAHNGWFTEASVKLAFAGLQNYLQADKLRAWLQNYDLENIDKKNIAVVMAGNIPMVGIHDFLCVLLAGHHLQAKLSSQDSVLIKEVAKKLIAIQADWENQISFVDRIKDFDAIIATGSDNTAKHFEYYFAKYPHIIRKNRVSVSVLNGKEDTTALLALGQDVLQYYGLGCRNVSKIYVPEGYDLTQVCSAFAPLEKVMDNHRYQNNYDYNKSIYLVNRIPHYDTGFLLLVENEQLFSPTSVLYYERYQNDKDLQQKIGQLANTLQCITADNAWFPKSIPLGKAQQPEVFDYADGVDTIQFLMNIDK
jgi:hypothetical protein